MFTNKTDNTILTQKQNLSDPELLSLFHRLNFIKYIAVANNPLCLYYHDEYYFQHIESISNFLRYLIKNFLLLSIERT